MAIVGLGSRGLSVLERIVTLAGLAGAPAGPVRVEIVDPSCSGSGVHEPGQPDYLLLNTTCSQVSMFPDSRSVGPDTGPAGPSLYTWAAERGLRLAADGYSVGQTGRPIRPTDFLPRRVLGEYLSWFLQQLLARSPAHVRLNLHCATALDMTSAPGGMLAIALSGGSLIQVSHAYLTTGYTDNTGPAVTTGQAGGHRVIRNPYPLPGQLADVAPGHRVAIGGFGLSAMDLMSCLTVGRGGRFAERDGRLEYWPSGREPVLLLYSRSGVPCRARPRVVEFGPRYQPLALTEAAIDAVRSVRGGPLDFDTDVLPLVLTEMQIAYRRCQARCAGSDAEEALGRELAAHASQSRLGAALDQLNARHGASFDPARTLDGSAGMRLADSAAYHRWLADYLAADLAEAELGFARSPVKAALDILRELRDTFRYAVDFGGLTSTSLQEFTRRTIPMINRAVVGPQYERHVELLTLMAAGIARTPFGPAPRVRWNDQTDSWTISSTMLGTALSLDADWVVSAHVPLPAVESSANPLISALYRKGWIRAHQPGSSYVHGIDVDRDQHPLDRRGCPDARLWVLGPLCEGTTFYNNLVPSPDVYSRPVFDAHRCVAAMFATGRPAPQPGTAVATAVARGTVASSAGRPRG